MSSAKRQSVRGAGRDTSGATGVTMQIWYELQQAGEAGLSFDEILARISPRVPAGYAWRKYLAYKRADIESKIRAKKVRSANPLRFADTRANRERAVRYTIQKSLSDMGRRFNAIKRPDGRYAVGTRKPRSYIPDEQLDYDGSLSRKAVSEMDLIRVLRPILEQIEERQARPAQHRHLGSITQPLATALKRWFDAHAAAPQP